MSSPSDAGSPGRPRLLFLAFGFPPAAKSSSYRLREIANQFAALGWDVTVLNAYRACWEDDYGVDLSMLDDVDQRIRVVEIPVRREDLVNDIRQYGRGRAVNPLKWMRRWDRETLEIFPEPKHGRWREPIEEAVLALQAEQPFDLCLVSCVPYVTLAAALRLHDEHGVPFAVDFRDGWSINVLTGEPAFELDSEQGRWEAEALEKALSLWVVNEAIAQHYRDRYPHLADKVEVVRNGFDLGSIPDVVPEGTRDDAPLRFGYLGTVSFPPVIMTTTIEAWRLARDREPLLHDATFEIRGHIGASYAKHVNANGEIVRAAADAGVILRGPVPKAEVSQCYAQWDALVLMLPGGRHMTSGKVYEYMATGLPIVSVHEPSQDAAVLLQSYPLWAGPSEIEAEGVAAGFIAAARLARTAGPDDRRAALEFAERYERSGLIATAARGLATKVTR